MKSLQFKLDQTEMVESFFSNAQLVAIRTDLEGYQLIQILNKKLDYQFRAAPEHQFRMQLNAMEMWGTPRYEDAFIEFNLYSNLMPPCITEMYLYENVSDGYHLLPHLRYYNFILLVYHAEMLLYDHDFIEVLSGISEIQELKEVALKHVVGKELLMF